MSKKALILNYHFIGESRNQINALGNIYCINVESFEQQMKLIKAKNIPVVSLNQIIENRLEAPLSIAITFDDGNTSDHEVVTPILKKFDYKACFFLSIKHIQEQNDSFVWEKYKNLLLAGHEMGSHGVNHQNLTDLSDENLSFELEDSKNNIENNLTTKVRYFSIPFGNYNKKVVVGLKKSEYEAAFSTEIKPILFNKKTFVFPRWNIKKTTTITTFESMLNIHSYTFRKEMFLSKMKTLLKKIIGIKRVDKFNVFLSKKRRK